MEATGTQLLARARYNNVAESQDELSFRQGDVVTVVKKDFNKQVDWWLCELRGKVGMVPANYFEVFHNHDTSEYDIPRPSKKAPRTDLQQQQQQQPPQASPSSVPLPSLSSSRPLSSSEAVDAGIYDLPPTDGGIMDRDYDLPPAEVTPGFETYDRPPSSNRGSPHGSARSSLKSTNRMSTASSVASSTGIYDIPPDLTDVYDFPKSNHPAKGFEEDEKQANILQAVDISSLMDDEAEDMLRSYCQVITATYEALFNTVYGADAYWGTDYKSKRQMTLKATIMAARHFDKAVLILLQFGKGVVNKLEHVSDLNFKRKYLSAFKGLLHNRNDILGKLEALNFEAESVTGTVKSLLEIARTIPRAVTEFTVLVQANKSILFKCLSRSGGGLPVITRSEAKSRPLPELPQPLSTTAAMDVQDGDYAIPIEDENQRSSGDISLVEYSGTLNPQHRKPNDNLPPLPFATLPRSAGKISPGQKQKAADPNPKSPAHSGGGGSSRGQSPHSSRSNILQSHPSPSLPRRQIETAAPGDYDEIERATRDRSVVLTSRPSLASLGSNSSRGPSPTHHHRFRRQGSLSSCSSSDDLNNSSSSGMRRANSVELLDSPYGRPNSNHSHHSNHQRQLSSPQPLKMEEKLLLDRFAKQFDLILPGLRDSMDMLLDCLRDKEQPKEFVTKSKLTVVAAYKLVYVADALSQKIVHTETKNSISASSNDLAEGIKNLVSATKTAALQYPSVIALDKMGGNIKQLYPCALDLINSVKGRSSI